MMHSEMAANNFRCLPAKRVGLIPSANGSTMRAKTDSGKAKEAPKNAVTIFTASLLCMIEKELKPAIAFSMWNECILGYELILVDDPIL
jgi:hypothetical protein